MAFNALLMCREEKHLRVLGKALDEVSMEQEVCLSAPEALDLTVQRHYSALVIDFDFRARPSSRGWRVWRPRAAGQSSSG